VNKRVKGFLAVLAIGGFLLSYQDTYAEGDKGKGSPHAKTEEKAEKVPDVVATINGVKISGVEFSKGLQSYKKRLAMMGQQVPLEHAKEINKTIIDDLVNRELLIQNCNKTGIKISDDELNKEITAIKSRFPSEEQFNQAVKSQNLTMEDVKSDVRRALSIKKLMKNDIEDKITIDEKAVNEYYKNNPDKFVEGESVKASHILVMVDKNAAKDAKETAKKKIDGLLIRVRKGEDFAKLAKENSDDKGSGQNGGDLGFFGKGMMVPNFEKAAFSLKKDEVSDIVETEFGYHIIKLIDKKPSRTIPMSEVHDRLKNFLKSMEVNKKLSEYLADLRKKADVKIVEF
jgi:peptidyl-prolyl cis-trans isomerase C